MLRRRILFYFLVATLVSVVAAVGFAWRSTDASIAETRKQELRFAQTVARFVAGLVQRDSDRLDKLLQELPLELENDAKSRELLAKTRDAVVSCSGVAVFDADRQVLVTAADTGGLPPQEVLMPALRGIDKRAATVVTDAWHGVDGFPRIAVIRSSIKEETWRAAVASIRLDSASFMNAFSYFMVDDRARLQLLDSTGVAIFSTRDAERYRSVVHGTYYSDAVRHGDSQMACHSCHESESGAQPKRNSEVLTLAKVPNLDWSVTIRKSSELVDAARRKEVFSHFGLVSVVLGVFAGFFLLLRQYVLKPMRQLTEAAAKVSYGSDRASELLERGDELSVLARSFEIVRAANARRETAPDSGTAPVFDGPAKEAGNLVTSFESKAEEVAHGASIDEALRMRRTHEQHALAVKRGLETALASVFAEVTDKGPVRSAMGLVRVDPGNTAFVAGGIPVTCPEDAIPVVIAASESKGVISTDALAACGMIFETSNRVRQFHVFEVRLLDSFDGFLWMGLGSEFDGGNGYLSSTLGLFVAQIVSLVERTYLYAQLQEENLQKNRMLGHLFEVEAEERRRIARDLHDQTAQDLTALLLLLETFPSADQPEEQRSQLERAKGQIGTILDGTDRLILSLRPAVLDDLGLVEATRAIGKNLIEPAGIQFDLSVEGEERDLPKRVEVAAFRVIQEAATNIVRHSKAKRTRAQLSIDDCRLSCTLEDNGCGLDLSYLSSCKARQRWGVVGMRERILQMGGTIQFSKPEGGGLRIHFTVPLTATQDQEHSDDFISKDAKDVGEDRSC